MTTLQERIAQLSEEGKLRPRDSEPFEWTLDDGTMIEVLSAKFVPTGRDTNPSEAILKSEIRIRISEGLFAVEGNSIVPFTKQTPAEE